MAAVKPTIALLALAAVAVTARLLRKRHAAPPPQYDDGEVWGMPTVAYDGRYVHARWSRAASGTTFVELAPTSRN